jgi:hypothetical protein
MLHPDVLRTLAEARHADLLNERRSRRPVQVRSHWRRPGLLGARRLVGSLLMWSGERLIGEERNALGLVPECSREAL